MVDHRRKTNLKRRVIIVVFAAAILLAAGFFIYTGNYYHADQWAEEVMNQPAEGVDILSDADRIVFMPGETVRTDCGLIFYPGGKVQAEAYAPLMNALAEDGIVCVLVKMPFRLAVFDVNAAEGIQNLYPDVAEWYIAGHSLGGAMAAVFAEKHAEEFEGLILLAAYSAADLTKSGLSVLSVRGSEDMVLNLNSYEKYSKNLPDTAREAVIEGGCHGYFGSYGMQKGDGIPSITCKEQTVQTAELIRNLLFS